MAVPESVYSNLECEHRFFRPIVTKVNTQFSRDKYLLNLLILKWHFSDRRKLSLSECLSQQQHSALWRDLAAQISLVTVADRLLVSLRMISKDKTLNNCICHNQICFYPCTPSSQQVGRSG